MENKTRMHAQVVSFASIVVAAVMGFMFSQMPQHGIIDTTTACGLVVAVAVVAQFAAGLNRYVRIVPLIIMTVGQAGLLIPHVQLQSPFHAFLAAGLATIVLVVVCTVEARAAQRSVQTP